MQWYALAGLGILLIIAIAAGLLAGPVSVRDLLSNESLRGPVLMQLRIPRVILGIFVGAALAVAGAAFQGTLRNPLATPYTLGVAGGASLGAYVVIFVQNLILRTRFNVITPSWYHLVFVPLGAFAGGLLTVALVYGLAKNRGKLSSYSLILAGVVINFTFASVILLLNYISDFTQVFVMIRWMMGGLTIVGSSVLYVTVPIVVICLALLLSAHRSFDILAFGEVTAHSMGLDVERFIRWVFIVTSIMVGMCVAVCGPIGFVGLVIPHVLRLAFGGRHSFLLPASMIGGAAFLCFADALARVILPNQILPVGVLTALIGGPILAVLLLRGGGYEVRD